jgi:hypothetical protein
MKGITEQYKFVLLPPPGNGGKWYGYMVHDDIPDLDESIYAYESTPVKCASALTKRLKQWIKDQP